MKQAFFLLVAVGLVSFGLSTFAHADAGSICEQNPDAPLCRPLPGR